MREPRASWKSWDCSEDFEAGDGRSADGQILVVELECDLFYESPWMGFENACCFEPIGLVMGRKREMRSVMVVAEDGTRGKEGRPKRCWRVIRGYRTLESLVDGMGNSRLPGISVKRETGWRS